MIFYFFLVLAGVSAKKKKWPLINQIIGEQIIRQVQNVDAVANSEIFPRGKLNQLIISAGRHRRPCLGHVNNADCRVFWKFFIAQIFFHINGPDGINRGIIRRRRQCQMKKLENPQNDKEKKSRA